MNQSQLLAKLNSRTSSGMAGFSCRMASSKCPTSATSETESRFSADRAGWKACDTLVLNPVRVMLKLVWWAMQPGGFQTRAQRLGGLSLDCTIELQCRRIRQNAKFCKGLVALLPGGSPRLITTERDGYYGGCLGLPSGGYGVSCSPVGGGVLVGWPVRRPCWMRNLSAAMRVVPEPRNGS